jgi:transposase
LGLVSDEPDPPGGDEEQRELLARLRAVVEAKDAENAVLRAELAAERELRKRLELQVAELQRRLGMDSTDSGTPTSREPIGARERRKAERRSRQESERERHKDRKRGGQPGHPGRGLSRDPDPDERQDADPPAGIDQQAARMLRGRYYLGYITYRGEELPGRHELLV